MSSVAFILKNLRKAATPRLTVREMAQKLGMPTSSYNRYETVGRFKKPFLPMDLTRRIAAVLADHNVDPDRVLALAGIDEFEQTTLVLSSNEKKLIETCRNLSSHQRRLLQQLANQMHTARSDLISA